MSSNSWKANDILGLTPGLDLRRSERIYAVGGSNFAFTSLGPRSMFGSRFLTPYPLGRPAHVQGVRVRLREGDRCFIFEGQSILEWSESLGNWRVIWMTPITNVSPYRWTVAYINEKIFFCHPVTGIIVYDLDTGQRYAHNGPGVPSQPLAICANNGRLVVIDDIYLSWSWQSDGMNFTPALGQAGQQKINDRVAGFPIMVNTYAQGVLTWTTGGLLRSEFTGDQEVYRHRNMNTEFRPINSFCTLQTDENTIMFLDERGLFQSTGGVPEPVAPLFNEFLIDYIRKNKLAIGQNARIEWDDLRRFMYVSVSVTPESSLYERAFVLYPNLDKWGVFSESHYGIVPCQIGGSIREGSYFGYVGADGRVNFWSDFASREVIATDPGLNLRCPVNQKITQVDPGGSWTLGSSTIGFNSEPMTPMLGPAGFYAPGSNTPAAAEVQGLGAKIQIGLIRFDQEVSFDALTEVISVGIGNNESGPEGQLSEDYLTVPDGFSDEDYNALTGAEDFGEGTLAYVNHGIRIISTIDGRSQFQEAIPDEVQFAEGMRHYACSTVGVWHILELTANAPGEAFHLRAFELTATPAGRLS